jgi:hypothetical protein
MGAPPEETDGKPAGPHELARTIRLPSQLKAIELGGTLIGRVNDRAVGGHRRGELTLLALTTRRLSAGVWQAECAFRCRPGGWGEGTFAEADFGPLFREE